MNRYAFVLCCLAVLAAPLGADELRHVPFYRFGIASDYIGLRNLVLADLTGDARPEIVACSGELPVALGWAAGGYTPLWHGPAVTCTSATAGDADGDGATDVIVVTAHVSSGGSIDGGQVLVFDPRGFGGAKLTATLPAGRQATDVAFGNVDFDPEPEIVVISDNAAYVYDARTLALQWSVDGYGGHEVALGDVDGDSRLEIIVNDETFGAMLDGGNKVVKWGYVGGFGQNMEVGNVDGDAKAEIVFPDGEQTYTHLVILNGDFSKSELPFAGVPVGIGDANRDGVNEIVLGTLKGIRPSDGSMLWSVDNSPEGGVFGDVAIGDVDGDGNAELVWGAGTDSFRDILIVADVVTHTIEFAGLDLDGPLHTATGDVDGDGRADLVVASHTSNNDYDASIVQIVDPRTHAVKGTLSDLGLDDLEITRIAIGQLDADPAREIVALGGHFDPIVVVWDAATREIQWQSAAASSELPLGTDAMVVANIDGDPLDEIIVGTTNANLVVFNGATGMIQTTRPLNGNVRAISLADVDHDGTLEAAVGTTSTLYLLDTANWSVVQQTPLGSIRDVAATGENGGRIAVSFDDSTPKVRLYDLALTTSWTCGLYVGYDYAAVSPLTFLDLGGDTRLIGGTASGSLMMFPITGGTVCPAASTFRHGAQSIHELHSVDATGDGWPELVVDGWREVSVEMVGLSTEVRGDVDGDGVIATQDVHALADSLFGVAPGLLPMADVNADERISPEDLFALIEYEYAGGPEPQP